MLIRNQQAVSSNLIIGFFYGQKQSGSYAQRGFFSMLKICIEPIWDPRKP